MLLWRVHGFVFWKYSWIWRKGITWVCVRFIILSSFIIGFVSFFISYNKKKDASLPDKLEQMMCRTKMNVHCDPLWLPNTLSCVLRTGSVHSFMKRDICQFYLGICWIAQTAFVITNFGIYRAAGNGTFCHGTACHWTAVEVIISFFPGPLISAIGRLFLYQIYCNSKSSSFMQSLSYPVSCTFCFDDQTGIDDFGVGGEKRIV